MANKLSRILPQYRNYQADQVLTHTQLNETIAYFEDQDRLSRVGLTGVGIVNGLTLRSDLSAGVRTVTIEQGYGITTDGDLLTLQLAVEETGSKEKTILIDSLAFTHYRPFEDDKANYEPFVKTAEETVTLLELCLPSDEAAIPLSGLATLDQHVFLLYLESYPKDQDICGDINCDNQGIEQVARLRVLLILEEDMATVCAADSIYHRFRLLKETLTDLMPIHPLHVVINDANVQTPLQLDRLYRDAIIQGNSIQELNEGLSAVLDALSHLWEGDPVITPFSTDLIELTEKHFVFPPGNVFQHNQYRYALLKDLLEVYNALLRELNSYYHLENPDINAFPKHLLLGSLAGQGYRHGFYASPAVADRELKTSLLRKLRKMYHMLQAFDVTQDSGLRIIPSAKGGSQGEQSIPFYYADTVEIRKNWTAVPGGKSVSYHYVLGDNPLLTDHTSADLYHVGGHLGKNAENTFQAINNMIRQFGLDVVVYLFDLSTQAQAFRKFLQEHTGCVHAAGVPKSGTYILLSNNNEVIGDLALRYRVVNVQATASISHIKVAETRYPWISSLSYLNNLVRGLRGTPKKGAARVTHYRLVVSEYRINGQSLTTGPTEVLISLEDVLHRRMHAITEALNTRFPSGLVFDYNEQLKKFLITRAYDDEFTVTFADNTLTVSAPAFTYTQDGMFRADRLFRLNAIRSEERRRYRTTTYQQLHGEFAPVDKDDDYGKYKGKWADWYRLIETLNSSGNPLVAPRFITSESQLPASVRGIIYQVYSNLSATERSVELYLTGDWLDGSWVSIEMLNRYGKSTNTADPIVRFLKVRESLHHKVQATKASLFLVLGRESDRTLMQDRLAGFTEMVDVYIDGPRVGRRTILVEGMLRLRITGNAENSTSTLINPRT
nr:hypothetical protein [Cytophagales bacterium]